MQHRWSFVLSLSILCCLNAAAKDKKKIILPADVLRAQTVLVVVDPDAGTAIEDPMANRNARDNVEKALANWGRFRLVMDASTADLIISIRKGSDRMVQPTIGGIPNNNRPVIFQPSDSGGTAGGRAGTPPTPGDPTSTQPQTPHPQIEAGDPVDTFLVYRGQRDHPLDFPPVWRFMAREALRSPGVPAVDAFRKAIAEAEKQQASQP